MRWLAGPTGAAKGNISAGNGLNFQRAMLHDVPHPGAFILAQTPDEAAGFAVGTTMLLQAR